MGLPPKPLALRPRSCESAHDPLAQPVSFERRQRAENVKLEPARSRGQVESFPQADERNLKVLKFTNQPYDVTLGEHTLTSLSYASDTSCNLTPMQFTQDVPFKVNVLNCVPDFATEEVTSGRPAHLPAGTVYVYTALTGDHMSDAIEDATNKWNAVLGGTVTFEPTDTDCVSGPNCIRITENVAVTGGCARTAPTTANSETGVITGNVGIWLRVGEEEGWRTYGLNTLTYVLAHELGHHLGLDDHDDESDYCSTTHSVMSSPMLCEPTGIIANVGIDNWLPVKNSSYGGATTQTCGF